MAARRKPTNEGIAAELLSLLGEVTTDGRLTDEEAAQINTWLLDNQDAKLPGLEFLRTCLTHALADGTITEHERSEIHRAVERVLPIELRRDSRERRTALAAIEKARIKDEKAARTAAERAERLRNRPTGSANFMVAGVLYEGRAATVEQFASTGVCVFLVREPTNPHDQNAILVRLTNGMDIGYAPREFAVGLAPKLDSGDRHLAHLTKILEGRRAPIPVVQAYLYPADSTIEGAVAQSAVPKWRPARLTSESSTAEAGASRPAQGCGCSSAAALIIALATATLTLLCR